MFREIGWILTFFHSSRNISIWLHWSIYSTRFYHWVSQLLNRELYIRYFYDLANRLFNNLFCCLIKIVVLQLLSWIPVRKLSVKAFYDNVGINYSSSLHYSAIDSFFKSLRRFSIFYCLIRKEIFWQHDWSGYFLLKHELIFRLLRQLLQQQLRHQYQLKMILPIRRLWTR